MKINAKLAVLAGAALLFGASSAVAQDYDYYDSYDSYDTYDTYTTVDGNTTTTVTTTTVTTETTETTDTTTVPVANQYTDEYSETTTSTVTRVYDGYVSIPVETTTETTYTVRTGTPEETWSTADFYAPGAFSITNKVSSDIIKGRGNFDAEEQEYAKGTGTNYTTTVTVDTNGKEKVSVGKTTNNKTTKETVTTSKAKQEYAAEFAGIKEQIIIDYDAKRLKFKVAPEFTLGEKYGDFWGDDNYTVESLTSDKGYGLNVDDIAFYWSDMDWFVELWPFELVSLDLHRNIWTPGSYLPVADTHIHSGNLGSSGFSVVAYPIKGLRLSGTIPFSFDLSSKGNFINAEEEDLTNKSRKTSSSSATNFRFNAGFGVDYQIGNFLVVGATARDIADSANTAFGVHASLIALENIFVNLGFTYNFHDGVNGLTFDYFALGDIWNWAQVDGHLLFNLAAGANLGRFGVGLDAVVGLMDEEVDSYDLYIGLNASYDLVPNRFTIGLKGFGGLDLTDGDYEGPAFSDYGQPAWRGTRTINTYKYEDGQYSYLTTDATGLELDGRKPLIGFQPYATYSTGNHEFGAAFVLELGFEDAKEYYLKIPVYWQYKF